MNWTCSIVGGPKHSTLTWIHLIPMSVAVLRYTGGFSSVRFIIVFIPLSDRYWIVSFPGQAIPASLPGINQENFLGAEVAISITEIWAGLDSCKCRGNGARIFYYYCPINFLDPILLINLLKSFIFSNIAHMISVFLLVQLSLWTFSFFSLFLRWPLQQSFPPVSLDTRPAMSLSFPDPSHNEYLHDVLCLQSLLW